MIYHSALEVAQDKARQKCKTHSEANLHALKIVFDEVFQTLSDTLHPVWNNYELMVKNFNGEVDSILRDSGRDSSSNRRTFEAILSAFSLGLAPIKNLIYEGAYIESATLLRSKIEALAQFRRVIDKKYKNKKVPNISHLDSDLKRVYGELSGLTHLSDSEFLANITRGTYESGEELITPLFCSLTPRYNHSLAQGLFALHIVISISALFLLDEYLMVNVHGFESSERINGLDEVRSRIWKDYLEE